MAENDNQVIVQPLETRTEDSKEQPVRAHEESLTKRDELLEGQRRQHQHQTNPDRPNEPTTDSFERPEIYDSQGNTVLVKGQRKTNTSEVPSIKNSNSSESRKSDLPSGADSLLIPDMKEFAGTGAGRGDGGGGGGGTKEKGMDASDQKRHQNLESVLDAMKKGKSPNEAFEKLAEGMNEVQRQQLARELVEQYKKEHPNQPVPFTVKHDDGTYLEAPRKVTETPPEKPPSWEETKRDTIEILKLMQAGKDPSAAFDKLSPAEKVAVARQLEQLKQKYPDVFKNLHVVISGDGPDAVATISVHESRSPGPGSSGGDQPPPDKPGGGGYSNNAASWDRIYREIQTGRQ